MGNEHSIHGDGGNDTGGTDTDLIIASKYGNLNEVTQLLEATPRAVHDIGQGGQTALMAAVYNDYPAVVKVLVQAGADIEKTDYSEYTALMHAAMGGKLEVVKVLVEAGADLEHASLDGETPLLWAVRYDRLEVVNALLQAGADKEKADNSGKTPLIQAVFFKSHLDIVNTLLRAGSDRDKADETKTTALMQAAATGRVETVKVLLTAGADKAAVDRDGRTALMLAAERDYLNVVNALLRARPAADVDQEDRCGWTALTLASMRNFLNVVLALLQAGADKNKADSEGFLPHMRAASKGHLEVLKALLQAGANLNHANNGDHTALMLAAENGRLEVVTLLLQAGAEREMVNYCGVTALMLAAEGGHLEVVRALVDAGADKVAENDNGRRAWDVAKTEEIKELLGVPPPARSGADLVKACGEGDVKTVMRLLQVWTLDKNTVVDGYTALMLAAQSGHFEILDALLTKGAKADTQNEDGNSALMLAAKGGHLEVVTALLEVYANRDMVNKDGHSAWDLAKTEKIKQLLGLPLFHALQRECDRVLQQAALAARHQASALRMQAVTARLSAAHAARDITLIANITREKAALAKEREAAARWSTLSEEDTRALPGKMRDLEDRLFDLSLQLTQAPECDVDMLDQVAELQRSVREALETLAPAPTTPTSTAEHDEYETPEYFSGNVLITDVTPAFTADSSRQASAPSARLMLRGRFQTVDQFNQLHKYQCVIKCAAHTASAPPGQESVAALRREHDMYLEVQRLSGDRQSGCVALYSAHPSYLVLEDHGADLRDLLSTSLRSPQLVLEAVVSAVHALHSLDIMHGDIKPQNMLYKLYDHGYVVKMCDLDAAYKVGETCAADSLGTKNYHAPELRAAALRGESIAAALSIDLFALGLSMWQVVARSSHAALDGSDEGALYADQEALNAHLNYPPIYKKILQSVTAIDPVQRTNMADLSRAIKMLSASSAQQGWLDQKAEHQQLKAAVGDELTSISEKVGVVGSQLGSLDGKVSTVSDQLGSVSLVLNNMDAKLDQVLEDVRSGFDLLASRAVEVGEAMRKEIMLGNQQLQLLPDMIAATQQALDQLSDDSCDQHAEQSENMQECLSFMEASIETAVTHALAAQKVSETGEFQTLVCQLQEQFADLSSEVRTHLQDQRLSSAHTAQLVEDLSETNECLKEGLTELLDSFTAIQAELAELKDNQRALGKQATEVLAGNAELHAMVRALTVNTHGMPTLAIVLPVVAKTWKGKLSPMRLVRNQYVLYFLCSHTHQIAPCGPEAKGYPINVTKQWLLDAAPVLRVGLVLVKTALVLSGLPLPVPDLNALLVDNAMHVQYLDTALGEVSRSASALNSAESATTQVLGAIDAHDNSQLVGVQGAEAEARLQEGSRKAYETIKEVLKADNIVLTCGLRQVVHGGKTAWVLDNDATEHAWKCAVDEAARA